MGFTTGEKERGETMTDEQKGMLADALYAEGGNNRMCLCCDHKWYSDKPVVNDGDGMECPGCDGKQDILWIAAIK